MLNEHLITEIKSSKYYGIMADSTPDISHIDQMSEVIKYVHISNGKVEVKEVFLVFFQLRGKKAEDLTSEILNKLKADGLDIMLCRGHGYDNVSIMAGIHGGLQARSKYVNKKALFNGGGSHSLNLCGGSIRSQKMLPVCHILGQSRRCFLSLLRPPIAGESLLTTLNFQ